MTTIAEPAAPVTDVPALRALLSRVQEAEDQDREIDELVGQLLDGFQYNKSNWYWWSEKVPNADGLPRYTGSIRDVLDLVKRLFPAVFYISFEWDDEPVDHPFGATLMPTIGIEVHGRAVGMHDINAGFSIAILAALIAALIAIAERRAERPST